MLIVHSNKGVKQSHRQMSISAYIHPILEIPAMTHLKLCLSASMVLLALVGSAQASTLPLSLDPLDPHMQSHWLAILENETIQSNLPF